MNTALYLGFIQKPNKSPQAPGEVPFVLDQKGLGRASFYDFTDAVSSHQSQIHQTQHSLSSSLQKNSKAEWERDLVELVLRMKYVILSVHLSIHPASPPSCLFVKNPGTTRASHTSPLSPLVPHTENNVKKLQLQMKIGSLRGTFRISECQTKKLT